jgi:hypothetical protein
MHAIAACTTCTIAEPGDSDNRISHQSSQLLQLHERLPTFSSSGAAQYSHREWQAPPITRRESPSMVRRNWTAAQDRGKERETKSRGLHAGIQQHGCVLLVKHC